MARGKSHRRYFRDGICRAYPNGKRCYPNVNQARYDKRILEVHSPDFRFDVFRCPSCKHWHIGRLN
jgi:hypothetical protein